jgi:hypothetical protein
MKCLRRSSESDERGLATIEFLMAIGFSLLLVAASTNLILIQYGRGIIRAAADESARVGARVVDNDTADATAIANCQQRQADALKAIGRLGTVTTSTCQVANGQVQTTVSASLKGWLPGMPDITTTANGTSVKEQAPQ